VHGHAKWRGAQRTLLDRFELVQVRVEWCGCRSIILDGFSWCRLVHGRAKWRGAQMALLDRFELLDQFECGVLWVPEEPNPWFELRFLIIKLWLFNHL
jgi:hypothetical protein